MQTSELWEDPFSEQASSKPGKPVWYPTGVFGYVRDEIFWTPGMPLPAGKLKKISKALGITEPSADLKVIHGRQERLLPHIEEIQNAAKEVLKDLGLRQNPDSRHLKEIAKRDLAVHVFYRYPDQPDLLTSFGLMINDHAIVLPVDKHLAPPVLDHLFPMQHVTEEPADMTRQQTILKACNELGLTQKQGLASDPMTPNRVVVYPRLLNFTSEWIQNVESPIFDIRYYERNSEAGYETDRSVAKRPVVKHGLRLQ
jgi:hypothetical protein